MLERSKRANLTVKVDLSHCASHTTKYLESALRHVDRFKVLSLENGDSSLLRALVLKLPKSAPRLHSLVISVYLSTFSETFFERDSVTCNLPEAMLCETENLHFVELRGCNPSWDSQLFSSLSHLKIEWVSRAARPTTKQFLEMLRRMPNLESLELREAIPVERSGSVQETVHLSGLHSLSLSSPSTEISNLLRYITFPPTTKVKIVADANPISDLDFSEMLSSLSSILASSDKKRGKKRGLDISGLFIGGSSNIYQGLHIQASSKLELQSDLYEGGLNNPTIDLTFSYRESTESSEQFLDSALSQIFHAFPLDNLGSLILSDVTPSLQILLDLFGTMNHLESMVLIGTSTHSLLHALQGTPTLEQPTPPVTSTLTFPGLRSLALVYAVFDSEDDDSGSPSILVDSLRDCLKQRRKQGAELHDLHLKECYYLYTDDVDLFEDFVGEVHWDEIEQEHTEEESEEEDEDDVEFSDDFEPDSDTDPYGWDYYY